MVFKINRIYKMLIFENILLGVRESLDNVSNLKHDFERAKQTTTSFSALGTKYHRLQYIF